ncbi:MAG TPA: metallophosphoesterase, partial [Thermomicrobiales bacterium]|nr:metallophosphoesterase [Thermomicrobiales bacterium]
MRIAAFSDLHIWGPVPKSITEEFQTLRERADILVIAGDITNNGFLVQAERAAVLLRTVQIPIVAVVGNHDRRTPRPARYRELIESAGVTLLDGSSIVFGDDLRVGFAGV